MWWKLSDVWSSSFSRIEICDDANQTSLLTIKNNHKMKEIELYIIVTQVPSFLMAQQSPVGQGLPTDVVSRPHLDTPHSVGLLWTSDQPDAPGNTQHSQETDFNTPGRIRTHDLSGRAAANQLPRPRGHWDRHTISLDLFYIKIHSTRYFSKIYWDLMLKILCAVVVSALYAKISTYLNFFRFLAYSKE